MVTGLYAAGVGMLALERKQDVVANNIANAATPGFKRQEAVDKGFYQLLYHEARNPFWANRINGPGGGLNTTETYTDFKGGPLEQTGDPLNVALIGPGFLSVQTPQGVRYTRDGHLSIDPQGRLTTSDGFLVQGQGGQPIAAQGTHIEIGDGGAVMVDGQQAGTLALTEFADGRLLEREGYNLWRATDAAQGQPAGATSIAAGMLEASNVQVPAEMVNMINVSRAYEANQRVLTSIDTTLQSLIERFGS